jgi:hypothetical protein
MLLSLAYDSCNLDLYVIGLIMVGLLVYGIALLSSDDV